MRIETRSLRLLIGVTIALMCGVGRGVRGATLILHPATPLVTPNSRVAMSLEAFDATGAPLAVGPVEWSVTDGSGAATISADGVLTGSAVGTITLTAMADGSTLTAPGYVLSPVDILRLSAPLVEAPAGSPVYLPLILSSSPAFTDASVTLRLFSDDPTAPPISPSTVIPADGATLASDVALVGGLQFSVHWTTAAQGPIVLANVQIDPPAALSHDTSYHVSITNATLTDSTGMNDPVSADSGTLILSASSPGPLSQLMVSPAQSNAYIGQAIGFTAAGADAAGNKIAFPSVVWSVEPANLGTIDSTGLFQPAIAGSGLIRATSGTISGTAAVTVPAGPAPIPEWIVAPAVTASTGTTVELPIMLGPLAGLAGLQFTVNVDSPSGAPPLAELDPVTGPLAIGSFVGGSLQPDGSQFVALLASRDLNGPGVLMNLRFQIPASAAGGTKYGIEIGNLDLSNGDGLEIPGVALSGEVDVMGDVTPPVVTLSGFTPGLVVSGTVSPTLTATDVDSAVAEADLLVDGAVVSSAQSAPYLLSWDTTRSTDGPHTVQVRAVDPSGNVGLSTSVQVVVDNTPPTAAISAPLSGEGLKGSVTIAGTATDAHFLSYRLRAAPAGDPTHLTDVDGSATQAVTAGTLATWNTATLPDGPYVLHLIVQDQAHNQTDVSVPVILANTPPILHFVNPPGTAVRGTVVLTVDSPDPLSEVDFSVDGAAPVRIQAAPWTLSLDTTKLSDGTHAVKATGLNLAGVPSDVSLSLLAVNTAPTLAITSPANGNAIRGIAPIQFTVTDLTPVTVVVDAGVGASPSTFAPIATVSVASGGTPAPIKWDTTSLPEGVNLIRVTATDAAGNASQAVASAYVDNSPPDLLVNSPMGDTWASNSLALDIDAADTGGLASITAAVDGAEIARSLTTSLKQTVSLSGVPEGKHTLMLSATDRAGNVESITESLTVDRTPPVSQIASPLPDTALTGDVVVMGTVTDPPPGDIASYRLDIGAGADPVNWQTILSGTGMHHSESLGDFTVAGIMEGGYTLRLVAIDRAGNTAESRVKVYIGPALLAGDVDSNGKVDVIDATRALAAVVGLITLDDRQTAAADLDHNGKIDIGDVVKILRIAVGLS